jgi:hypothetical protein
MTDEAVIFMLKGQTGFTNKFKVGKRVIATALKKSIMLLELTILSSKSRVGGGGGWGVSNKGSIY